jgi:hypothetical protein
MKLINRYLELSSSEWDVSYILAKWIFWVPIIGALFMAISRLNVNLYRFLLEDDGPVEWSEFVCFVIAMLAGTGVALKRFRKNRTWEGLLFTGFAFIMFFSAGEEIAWGQRILNIQTPEALAEVNKQDEITFHNIGETLDIFNLVMLAGGAFGSGAYFLNRKIQVEKYWNDANYLFVPPFFLIPAFLMVFLYKLIRFTVWTKSGFTITKYGEWAEFCLAFGLSVFVFLINQRLAKRKISDPENIATLANS